MLIIRDIGLRKIVRFQLSLRIDRKTKLRNMIEYQQTTAFVKFQCV